jgi:hypothetical protein
MTSNIRVIKLVLMVVVLPILIACGITNASDQGVPLRDLLPTQLGLTTIEMSPNFSSDATVFLGTEAHGVLRSNDGGANWLASNENPISLPVVDLAISPSFTEDGELYAGTPEGLYFSSDRGSTWRYLLNLEHTSKPRLKSMS